MAKKKSETTRYVVEVRELRPAPEIEKNDVVTAAEAARELGVTVHAIMNRIKNGTLTTVFDAEERHPHKRRRVLVSELEELVEEFEQAGRLSEAA